MLVTGNQLKYTGTLLTSRGWCKVMLTDRHTIIAALSVVVTYWAMILWRCWTTNKLWSSIFITVGVSDANEQNLCPIFIIFVDRWCTLGTIHRYQISKMFQLLILVIDFSINKLVLLLVLVIALCKFKTQQNLMEYFFLSWGSLRNFIFSHWVALLMSNLPKYKTLP